MARKDAFILTPVGATSGRYSVRSLDGGTTVEQGARTGRLRIVKAAAPRSKDAIREIVRTHATGLRRLADR